MEIKKINFTLAKPAAEKTEPKNNLISNPFGVSFKGNVIQADVFETSKPELMDKVSAKSKLFASAIVGGINNFNNAFKARMNSVVSFGQKIKNNVFETFDKITNTEISLDFNAFSTTLKDKLFPNSKYKVKNLVKLPVSDLQSMLLQEINA